jgi:hypothetical protein
VARQDHNEGKVMICAVGSANEKVVMKQWWWNGRRWKLRFLNGSLAIVLVTTFAGMTGCALRRWWGSEPATPEQTTLSTTEMTSLVAVTAFPAYRLVLDPAQIDQPSRLLVLRTRIEALDENSTLHFSPRGVRIILPDGTSGNVFDRARGIEILKRTDLAEGDLSYTEEGNARPHGGLAQWTKPLLRDDLSKGLLEESDFDKAQPLTGYLVVDTIRPLSSLDGVVLEVTAIRLGDAEPVRQTFQFAANDSSSASR